MLLAAMTAESISGLPRPMTVNIRYSLVTKGDFVFWGNIPTMKTAMPANPKTMNHGLPFEGKPINRDYGDFKGLYDEPIKLQREADRKYY